MMVVEVYKNILSANLHPNKLVGTSSCSNKIISLPIQQRTSLGRKWKVLDWPSQSSDPIEHAIHPLERRLKEKSPETNYN